ncbi:uncharacterized protein LOC117335524 isoform X2 [Pecten maximus]|uniref:uncharacterized protein LOC117335524 isoform X2 n=1 Tax=Pecten maximus TaxID=6579 RepID=UPI001458AA8C|nr:uncharacterized protein LOC117335524 isoform X2 [Pecten maximus]
MLRFSYMKVRRFTPDCYYDDLGLGTRGSCSDDVNGDVYQNSTLLKCQSICDSTPGCQGMTFQEDLRICQLHVCSDGYMIANNSLTSFYARRCEPYNQFFTAGTRTRATCLHWPMIDMFQVSTHLDCQIACFRFSNCHGVTVRPSRKWNCFLQACNESTYFDDADMSFYSKNYTGTGFTGHGSSRVGKCRPLNSEVLGLDINECAAECLNTVECQGFSSVGQRLSCDFHSCGSYMNMTGYGKHTFYSRTSNSTAISSSKDPTLPNETSILEIDYTQYNVTCDFLPTTSLSETCSPIDEEMVGVFEENECFHLCENTSDCQGVTLRSAGMTCYLHFCEQSVYTPNTNLRFSSKQVVRNCTYISKGPKTGLDCAYLSSSSSSLPQCQDTCSQNTACKGLQYDTSKTQCRLSICSEYRYRQHIPESTSFYSNSCEDVTFYEDQGIQTAGNCSSFEVIQVRSDYECISSCTSYTHCLGVTLNTQRLECWRYSCLPTSQSTYINGSSFLKVCSNSSDYTTQSTYSTLDGSVSPSPAADITTSNYVTQFESTQLNPIPTVTSSEDLVMLMPSIESTVDSYSTHFSTELLSLYDTATSLIENYTVTSAESCIESSFYSTSPIHSSSAYAESINTLNFIPSTTLSPYQSVTNQNITFFLGDVCTCVCHLEYITIESKIKDLVSSLKIDASKVSRSTRKLISVSDERTSSKYIGTLGVVLLASIGFVIVFSDLSAIFCQHKVTVLTPTCDNP